MIENNTRTFQEEDITKYNYSEKNTSYPDEEEYDLLSLENLIAEIEIVVRILSIAGLAVFIVKFFKSSEKQNLATRNLASYSISLILLNLFYILSFIHELFYELSYSTANILYYLIFYVEMTSLFLLCVMSWDTFITLRNSVYYLRLSKGPRTKSFVVFNIFCWGFPAIILSLVYLSIFTPIVIAIIEMIFVIIALGSRIICIIFFCMSVYYIKKASIRQTNTFNQLFIYGRLLIITGMTSILLSILTIVIGSLSANGAVLIITYVLGGIEGFIVSLSFTLKKDMFKRCVISKIDKSRVTFV